jgi:hypothetical protein
MTQYFLHYHIFVVHVDYSNHLLLAEYPDKIAGLLIGKRKSIPVTGCGDP